MALTVGPLAGSSSPHHEIIPRIRPQLTGKNCRTWIGHENRSVVARTSLNYPGRINISTRRSWNAGSSSIGSLPRSLADWTSAGSDSLAVLTVEDVIPKVVFKVVEAGNRVLLIVLDGMSWAVCHELLDDIRHEHWFLATLEESTEPPQPVIATIPSVTHFSRASLLSGKIESGDATVEKRNFEVESAPEALLR